MTKISAKCRICRRERTKLFLKGLHCVSGKCPLDRKGPVPPGIHGIKSSVRLSQYGRQLREKQKIKRFYGLREAQFKNLFDEAKKQTVSPVGEVLLSFLERRLDNVLYRLGITPSRDFAKRLIAHGHIRVNGKKITSSSYRVQLNDEIILDQKSAKNIAIIEWMKQAESQVPTWLEKKGLAGKVKAMPEVTGLSEELNVSLVIEFYSR